MDYLTLGSAPTNEDCAQVGSADYADKAWAECRRWTKQLIATFGEPPPGARFRVRSFPHDLGPFPFGTYPEVVIEFYENDEEATEYAYNVEGNLPEKWSD